MSTCTHFADVVEFDPAINDTPSIDDTTLVFQPVLGWLADLANSNDTPLWIKGANRRYVFANSGYAALFGMTPSEMLGQCDDDLLAPESARMSAARDHAVIARGELVSEETTLQTVDGEPLPVRITQRRLMHRGRPGGTVGWLKSHSKPRDNWEAREQRLLFQFSQAAHEVRSPLSGMVGMARLLADDPGLTTKQTRFLAAIKNCGQHLLGVADDMVDLGRACAGKLTLVPEKIDMEQLLGDVAQWVRPDIEAKQIAFRMQPFAVPAHKAGQRWLVDPLRLRQLLLNLLGNAVHHTDSGHVELRVSVAPCGADSKADQPEHVRLRFEIEDTGDGMTPDQLSQLFCFDKKLGSSADAPREPSGGLGLLISRRLARAMGGELQVSSERGKGTLFSFEINTATCDA